MFGAAPVLNSAPQLNARAVSWKLSAPAVAVALVMLPVFAQAPWVRSSPVACALFTAVLVALGLRLRGDLGALLIGFSGSWLAGAVFWGWLRLHPLWHLPVEAFALPLAIAGLQGPWRRAGQFYLGALVGTACTDAATALCGLMPLWPQVLQASPSEAPLLLSAAAEQVLQPIPLAVISGFAAAMACAGRWLWRQGEGGQVVAAALLSTLAVDGLFLALALLSPQLSGLV